MKNMKLMAFVVLLLSFENVNTGFNGLFLAKESSADGCDKCCNCLCSSIRSCIILLTCKKTDASGSQTDSLKNPIMGKNTESLPGNGKNDTPVSSLSSDKMQR
ncbi:hypothetical protein KBC04_00330 [Candidatus Babeliales bacterium]|nr:hypothetical protein [Candidatus Babeliales bacterium]MBP9843462.1 hypothetical protein [Candidatus Babeliales bacterium]